MSEHEFTIKDLDWIATEATSRLRREFQEYGFTAPPKISPAMVRIVLASADEKRGEGAGE